MRDKEDSLFLNSKAVIKSGDFVLKRKKNAKGSQAWDQFWIVCKSNDDKVLGMKCRSICKV